jgi:hypothetical protein
MRRPPSGGNGESIVDAFQGDAQTPRFLQRRDCFRVRRPRRQRVAPGNGGGKGQGKQINRYSIHSLPFPGCSSVQGYYNRLFGMAKIKARSICLRADAALLERLSG